MTTPDSAIDLIDAALAARQREERLEQQYTLFTEQRIDQRLADLLAARDQLPGV